MESNTQFENSTFLTSKKLKHVNDNTVENMKFLIYYGTTSGKTKKLCAIAENLLLNLKIKWEISLLDEKFPEDFIAHFKNESNKSTVVILFLLPTWTEGASPLNAKNFCDYIEECTTDFRIGSDYLKGLQFSVYGVGSSAYTKTYNTASKQLFMNIRKLGGTFVHTLGLGDENSQTGVEPHFRNWLSHLIKRTMNPKKPSITTDTENINIIDSEPDFNSNVDIEDIGIDLANSSLSTDDPLDMVTPMIRSSLLKQGYKIVGSHSGVKLCRWTKAMLRGRGGCYKHAFYGIMSYSCMEATPSLACANKCVFCWRHHTNPVGTEWKWNMDSPDYIVDNLIAHHDQMVKQMKGVPGADPLRLADAATIRHCALSLVGEPIMYPRINEIIDLLHQRSISTFLVTNAQFPDNIKNLVPVTQLYVSIDASTKDALKKVDRPLFADFWERFLRSIDFINVKKQRTVFRLTLVKGWNDDDISQYSDLVRRGNPSFIEIKAVTYCGQGDGAELRIGNTPYHEEVIKFSSKLLAFLPNYGLACEHEHSNSVLLANKKFFIQNQWHTWIDYGKFCSLYDKWKFSNGSFSFTELDYSIPTPHWALFGSREQGFNPDDTRFHRKKNIKN